MPKAASPEGVERCLLRLSGCGDDASAVAAFLAHITGFSPKELELEPHKMARAVIEGSGAYHAAAGVAGNRTDADRQFQHLGMHIEWFCPCGLSGPEPLPSNQVCASCEARRPADLLEAAQDATEWADWYRRKVADATAQQALNVPQQPPAPWHQPQPENQPSMPLPPLQPLPAQNTRPSDDAPAAKRLRAEPLVAPVGVNAPRVPPAAGADAAEPATQTVAGDGDGANQTQIAAPAATPAPPSDKAMGGGGSATSHKTSPVADAAADDEEDDEGADQMQQDSPISRQRAAMRADAAVPPVPPPAPPRAPHPPPVTADGQADDGAALGIRALKEQSLAAAAAAPPEHVERVELFLGGVDPFDRVNLFNEMVECLRGLTGMRQVQVIRHRGGSARANLVGPSAWAAAARIEGKVARGSAASKLFAEVKMFLDWYCPCGAPSIVRGGQCKERDRCGACGGERPQSLRQGAERAAWLRGQQQAAGDGSHPAASPPPPRAPAVAAPAAAASAAGAGSIPHSQSAAARPGNVPASSRTHTNHWADSNCPPPAAAPAAAPTAAPSRAKAAPPSQRTPWPTSTWDHVLGGNARARDLLRARALIYENLDNCLAVVKENNKLAAAATKRQTGRDVLAAGGGFAWRAWAFDLPTQDGNHGAPKKYVAAEVGRFGDAYTQLPEASRNVYEIIDAKQPCWPYFDLEFSRADGLNAHCDGDAMSELVRAAAHELLAEALAHAREADPASSGVPTLAPMGGSARAAADEALAHGTFVVESILLDSHRADKYSRHLILRPHLLVGSAPPKRIPMPLGGTESAKALAEGVCAHLGERLSVARKGVQSSVAAAAEAQVHAQAAAPPPPAGGAKANFVDLGVYTRSRCFRLLGSSKLGSRAYLRINDAACTDLPVALSPPLSLRPLVDQIRYTLVNPELPLPCAPAGRRSGLTEGIDAWVTLTLPDARPAGAQRSAAGQPRPRTGPAASGVAGAGGGSERGGASGACGAEDESSDADAWLASLDGVTDTPLLDFTPTIGPRHPFVKWKSSGSDAPPPPFAALARWARDEFARWGDAHALVRVDRWLYVMAAHPHERLLHLTAAGTRFCFHKGCAHKSNLTMISVDLHSGVAWQRCWDSQDCVETKHGRRFKAKHRLPRRPSANVLPSLAELERFERDTNETV